jgi:hypothetical protein
MGVDIMEELAPSQMKEEALQVRPFRKEGNSNTSEGYLR